MYYTVPPWDFTLMRCNGRSRPGWIPGLLRSGLRRIRRGALSPIVPLSACAEWRGIVSFYAI